MSQMTTLKWSFVEDVDEYYRAGIEGIGVWRRKLLEFGEERGAELLRDSGLCVTSLSMAGGFTGEAGESHRDAIRDARDAIQLAAEIRAASLVLVTGARAGHAINHARRLVREALRELAPVAVQLGVQLVLQPPFTGSDSRWTFLDSCRDALDLVQSSGMAHVGLMLDIDQLRRLSSAVERDGNEWFPWIKLVAVRNDADLACLFPERYAAGTPGVAAPRLLTEFHRQNAQGFAEIQINGCGNSSFDYARILHECSTAARCCTEIVVEPRVPAKIHVRAPSL